MNLKQNHTHSKWSDAIYLILIFQIDYMWDDLRKEFVNMDVYGTGFVTQEEFREVCRELCVHLSDYELDSIVRKFDLRKDGR